MSIYEFKYNIDLIKSFRKKLYKEPIPIKAQKVILKFYAKTLKINLTDKMLDDILISEGNLSAEEMSSSSNPIRFEYRRLNEISAYRRFKQLKVQ